MFLIDLIFPKFCLSCGFIGVYLCQFCQDKLKPIETDVCIYCKKPSLFGLTHSYCSKTNNIDGLLTIYHYNSILKKIIKNIKYRLATNVWMDFHKIITPEFMGKLSFYKKLSVSFVIQPIPLSKIKYNERGFNQAKNISVFFQKFLNFPTVDLLVRKKETLAQAQLSSLKKRYFNLKGAFAINPDCKNTISCISDKNIILIDDVITSGSTVKEAAKILKDAGAKKIYVLALAKG